MEPYNKNDNFVRKQWFNEGESFFHTCGLIVAVTDIGKRFLITWNTYNLLHFLFKKPKGILTVRIPLPIREGNYLRSVHALKYSTIFLMSDGKVYCIDSFKKLHLIKWLCGVLCLCIVDQGFSVIRMKNKRILLQMFLGFPSIEKNKCTLQQTFNIAFDEKIIFHSNWKHDEYTLTTLKVSEKEELFVRKMIGTKAVKMDYVHIFSFNGYVFALTSNHEGISNSTYKDHHIELLSVYAAQVRSIRIIPIKNLWLIFLNTGSIDIWYQSSVLKIKQRQIHNTGSKWLDYDATSINGDFYFTDGDSLQRLSFQYNVHLDECIVRTVIKSVAGIHGCTWVDHTRELVCLGDNNIFYRIKFDISEEKAKFRNLSRSLTDDFSPTAIMRLQNKVKAFRMYARQSTLLHQKLYMERETQQLISVIKNFQKFSAAIKINVEFHRYVPSSERNVVLLQPALDLGLHTNCIYAVIDLILFDNQPLLESTHWNLLIFYSKHVYVYLLPTEIIVKNKFQMVFVLKTSKNGPMPYIKIQLVGLIKFNSKIYTVLFPISVESSSFTYRYLFNGDPADGFVRDDNVNKKNYPLIRQAIRLDGLFFSRIENLFNTNIKVEDNSLKLYHINEKLQLLSHKNINETHLSGILESTDALAIYYFKQHILLNSEILKTKPSPKNDEFTFNKIMSDANRLFQTQSNDGLCSRVFRLKSKYTNIRNAVH
ncbi:uncharacterized protein LOC108115003 isoform X1 [Drosophila eugracilis]|uniref:uncharacterized protein LOC108115003 isoform X1 n=1 Tax=Drosophila eugracilis TaxID=29029 RepID=UPI001BDA77E4|nr:uncharacterized protein LOC108115003 isoform X1 [Drosophila eugracilis]